MKRRHWRTLLLGSVGLALIGISAFLLLGQGTRLCEAAPLAVTVGGAWTLGAPMPTARSEIAAAVLDGRIYVAGGFVQSASMITDAFEVYDPPADQWETLASLPVPLHHLGMAAYDGRLYVAGGFTGAGFSATDQAWVYDPAADAWTAIAPLPRPNGAHMLVVLGERLLLVGGANVGSALWAYDPAADTWDDGLAPMPSPREHLGAAAIDGQLYVVGGRWSQGNVATLEVYDPATNAWASLPDMPTARGGFQAAAVNDLLYAGGGEAFTGGGCTFERAEVYDPAAATWARLPDMLSPRHGIAAVGLEGRLYIIGGATGAGARTLLTASDHIDIFTPGGASGDG
jgi:N-acetylneuraminic acid mutarotase